MLGHVVGVEDAEAFDVGDAFEEQGKVMLPQRRSFFGEILRSPTKIAKARVLNWEIANDNKKREKEFLRSRLITEERDEEIEKAAQTFGTEGHADRVVDTLVSKLDMGL